jgi:putative peptide zinc metalloprotease protein
MRRTALAVVASVALFTLVAGAAAPAQAQDNTAIAINVKDGTDIFKLAFKIARANQQIVDQSNAAVAFNSCEECQSVAIAFQIVLIFSDPAMVTSENLALALNYECDACIAFASAYQWLLTTGGPVRFTAEGNKRLAAIRQRLHDLAQMDLTIEQLQAELEQIQAEIADILANELVAAGQPPDEGAAPPATTTTPEATPETTTAPTTTEASTTTTP